MNALDSIDKQIIALLQSNGKMNNKEIAGKIGLSVTPTFERIKRLERIGVIQGYTALINRKAIGKELKVVCQVSLKSHEKEGIDVFESAIKELSEVSHAYHVAGATDYMLIIEVGNMEMYQDFLKNQLAGIPHIGQVNSSFVMSELK
ncbi:Lrp/AsnC family transcriptional regulator [Fluviicola taffensis]|uniref:Transcriptional regulator, AsnC family n=1 Tax=Fluviicola taffensis (strain DSM 16823 / NCIMB 13979 / RW262) TaxID=755732 RepID=F2IDN6_FLUTR|nr:Lrp/AsnC family transcriptional regulator [Fluviicola taffensis]AEA43409.1 transcriptional regulator, AsnC family [Fluviicola taffensis DSM 16823]